MNRCLIGLTLLTALAPTSHALTVDCGHLLDVKFGVWNSNVSVVTDGNKIVSVGGSTNGNGVHVDLSQAYCLPGLIDSHTHLTDEFSATTYSDQFRLNPADYAIRGVANARKTLEAGFTTVRNLGDGHNESIALRNAIAKGVVPGPRIFTAGKAIGSTGAMPTTPTVISPVTPVRPTASSTAPRTPARRCASTTRMVLISSRSCRAVACSMSRARPTTRN